jgi:U32 family peptidase
MQDKKECQKIELVIPVRDKECLHAAISGGCDSIYFSCQDFNSDIIEELNITHLEYIISICKINKINSYYSVDIIIKEDEINYYLKEISYAISLGIDGIILQDLSIASIIKKKYPNIKIISSDKAGLINSQSINSFDFLERRNSYY